MRIADASTGTSVKRLGCRVFLSKKKKLAIIITRQAIAIISKFLLLRLLSRYLENALQDIKNAQIEPAINSQALVCIE